MYTIDVYPWNQDTYLVFTLVNDPKVSETEVYSYSSYHLEGCVPLYLYIFIYIYIYSRPLHVFENQSVMYCSSLSGYGGYQLSSGTATLDAEEQILALSPDERQRQVS